MFVLFLVDSILVGLCIRLYIKISKESKEACDEKIAKDGGIHMTSAVSNVRQVRPVRERKMLIHYTRH